MNNIFLMVLVIIAIVATLFLVWGLIGHLTDMVVARKEKMEAETILINNRIEVLNHTKDEDVDLLGSILSAITQIADMEADNYIFLIMYEKKYNPLNFDEYMKKLGEIVENAVLPILNAAPPKIINQDYFCNFIVQQSKLSILKKIKQYDLSMKDE